MHTPNERYPRTMILFEVVQWGFFLLIWIWAWSNNFSIFGVIIAIIVSSLFLYAGWIEPFRLKTENIFLHIPKLPSCRILVVSDIHIGPYKGKRWIRKTVQAINKTEADIVCIPGDFLYGGALIYAETLKELKDINKPVYATLGNHDHAPNKSLDQKQAQKIIQTLKDAHIKVLNNESLVWEDKSILIAGIDDNYLHFDNIEQAMHQGEGDKKPTVLLAHSPDILDNRQLKTKKPCLILCGHTHGGQIRFPFLGALSYTIPAKEGNKRDKGLKREHNIPCFISVGVGETSTRMRFLNPPTISLLNIN